jgi:hypothetical protein
MSCVETDFSAGAVGKKTYAEVTENTEFAEKSCTLQGVAAYLPVAVEAGAIGA